MKKILVEINATSDGEAGLLIRELAESGLVEIDLAFKPIPIRRRKTVLKAGGGTFVIRGQVSETNIKALSEIPFVVKIWDDPKIDQFGCGCKTTKKGTLNDVAECIGAKQIWNKGFQGDGIVIGIVDVGVDKTIFPQVINGSSPNWGYVNPNPAIVELHGNMSATDALGIAPAAKIYDLNYTVSSGGTIAGYLSVALAAFEWAIQQFMIDGTPHILSNSWGIYQENWAVDYATDPNHPFTLKVEEALDQGIKILFAAGNCGAPCKICNCGNDTGGNKDIWGANGHKEVMTVGAVKLNNKRLKYSSQGPAALSNEKPDFCGYSHFKGYYHSIGVGPDTGTSAACPVVAGGVALLLNYNNTLTQNQVKDLLKVTAKDLEGFGFDYNTGYGVVRLDNAYYELEPTQKPKKDFRDRLCNYVYHTERRCVLWADEGSDQCSQWADEGSNQCSQWADEGSNQCSQWADEGSNQCCTWWPCSWGCKAFYWVANWVCKGWYWVAKWVCKAWYWVAKWVCKAWYWVAKWVCKRYVSFVTGITFTNCKCR